MASRTRPAAFSDVDWQAPWLAPWRELGVPLAGAVASGTPVHEALNAAQGAPVGFVPQAELPAGVAYEQFIFDTGCVPTRSNLHDFFSGLVWQRFGQDKQRLNQLQRCCKRRPLCGRRCSRATGRRCSFSTGPSGAAPGSRCLAMR